MLNHKKRQMASLFAVCLGIVCFFSGCSDEKKSSMISSELISQDASFGQDTAKSGDFVETKTFDAERIYPISTVVMSPNDGVILEEINVVANEEVKKGDLLVSIQPITDELIKERQDAIDKNKEETDKVLKSYQATISNLQEKISATSGAQKKIHQAELKKAKRQAQWYEQDGNEIQEEMKAQLEQLKKLQGDLNIYAPYDGVIDTVSNIQAGTELVSTREILTMHSEEQVLLNVNEGSQLHFGQSVTVETGSGENIKTYSGTVISSNDVRNDALKTGDAYIRIEDSIPPDELKNVRVKANVKELYNVLVVKNYAVTTEKDKQYVTIIDGETLMKRRVMTGGSCGEYTWILQGLTEGQEVTMQ